MRGLVALGRHVGLATLAGLIAGVVVGGLLGRVVMRVSGFMGGPGMVGVRTSNGNRVGDITLEGTIGLILFAGVATGVLGGILYAGSEPWLRRSRPWSGLVFGIGLFAAVGFTTVDPSNVDFARFGSAPVNVAMFAALFVLFGIAIAWLLERLRAVAAGRGTRARVVEGLGWLALLPVAPLMVAVFAGLGANSDPLPAVVIAAALAIAAAAHWRRFPPLIGYAALAVPLMTGSVRLAGGLTALLAGL